MCKIYRCFWPSFQLRYSWNYCLVITIKKDARWRRFMATNLSNLSLHTPYHWVILYHSTVGTQRDTQYWIWVFIWTLVRISAFLQQEYIIYTSVRGLNLGMWLALANGLLANMHSEAWVVLSLGHGISWCWKSFSHQVNEPRLACWVMRGWGHPPSRHWDNCHTYNWGPQTNQTAKHQTWVSRDLAVTRRTTHSTLRTLRTNKCLLF